MRCNNDSVVLSLQILERLRAWQGHLSTPCSVVLLPAVEDVFHHPTFPQPAIDFPPEQVSPRYSVASAADKGGM